MASRKSFLLGLLPRKPNRTFGETPKPQRTKISKHAPAHLIGFRCPADPIYIGTYITVQRALTRSTAHFELTGNRLKKISHSQDRRDLKPALIFENQIRDDG